VFTEKIDMSVTEWVLNFTWEDVVAKKHQEGYSMENYSELQSPYVAP
jgi:hypothetical protein